MQRVAAFALLLKALALAPVALAAAPRLRTAASNACADNSCNGCLWLLPNGQAPHCAQPAGTHCCFDFPQVVNCLPSGEVCDFKEGDKESEAWLEALSEELAEEDERK